MVMKLTNEMIRVTKEGGHTVLITHTAPEKRMSQFESYKCYKEVTISHKQLLLSNMAQLINFMRSDNNGKSLKELMEDKEYIMNAVREIMLLRKEEELLESSDPKHKMIGMMLKARRTKQEEQRKLKANSSSDSKEVEEFGSLRQDHCYMYIFLRNLKTKY